MSTRIRWPWWKLVAVFVVSLALVGATPFLFRVQDFLAGDLQVLDGPPEMFYLPASKLLACLVATGWALLLVPRLAAPVTRPRISFCLAVLVMLVCTSGGIGYARLGSQVAADSIVENGPGFCVWPWDIPLLIVGLPGPLIALALAWGLSWFMAGRKVSA